MTITPEEIARLRALEAAATAGPWYHYEGDIMVGPLVHGYGPKIASANYEGGPCRNEIAGFRSDTVVRAAFIAEARNALPALLAEVGRLRAVRDHFNADCDAYNKSQIPLPGEHAMMTINRLARERDALRAEVDGLRASQNERAIEALYEVRRKTSYFGGGWLSTEIEAQIAALMADAASTAGGKSRHAPECLLHEIQPGPEATAPQSDEDGA